MIERNYRNNKTDLIDRTTGSPFAVSLPKNILP
jgi:hypothetical protein